MTSLNPTTGVAASPAVGAILDARAQLPGSRNDLLLAALAAVTIDQVDILSLVGSDRAALVEVLDHTLSPQATTQLAQLFKSAVRAANFGNLPEMLTHLTAFATLDPRRAETLESDPALASARGEVKQLLERLAFAAKSMAETRLEQARQLPEIVEVETFEGRALKPEVALLVAQRLIETGGYANCIHSTELSQLVLDYSRWAPANVAVPMPEPLLFRARRSRPVPVRLLFWIAILLGALLLLTYWLSLRIVSPKGFY